MTPPTIVIAEDHELVGQGLRTMLERQYVVLELVKDGDRVLSAVKEHRPDVLLLDLSLPHRTGMDILPDVVALTPAPKVLIVSMHLDRVLVDLALQLGAAGYVPKDAPISELCTGIEEALGGRIYVSPHVPKRSHRGGHDDPMGFARLTPRQQEIVRHIGHGLTTDEIAQRLGVSTSTINYHRKNIRKELGVHSDWEMARYALLVTMSGPGSEPTAPEKPK